MDPRAKLTALRQTN